MRLAIFGVTGSVGRLIAKQALDAGHVVTALVRETSGNGIDPRVRVIHGDAVDPHDVDRTVVGSDVVISTLGHAKDSPNTILAAASKNFIHSMQAHAIRRLVVLAPVTVKDPSDQPGLSLRILRAIMWVADRPVAQDHNEEARLIEDSRLDWTIVRVGQLIDGPKTGRYRAGSMTKAAKPQICRPDVADFMLAAATNGDFVRSLPWVSR